MRKFSAAFAVALLVCTAQASAGNAAPKRSFAECQKIALERGVRVTKLPQRYTELGPKAKKPTGLIAQCMAGKLT